MRRKGPPASKFECRPVVLARTVGKLAKWAVLEHDDPGHAKHLATVGLESIGRIGDTVVE